MLKFLDDFTIRKVYNFRIKDYWTPIALVLFISIFFSFGTSLPVFVLAAYLGIQREKKINSFRYAYDTLGYYYNIEEMVTSGKIDKEKLASYVRIVEQNDFEQLGYSLDLKHEEIQAVIDKSVTPYKKSFYETGLILNNPVNTKLQTSDTLRNSITNMHREKKKQKSSNYDVLGLSLNELNARQQEAQETTPPNDIVQKRLNRKLSKSKKFVDKQNNTELLTTEEKIKAFNEKYAKR